MIKKAMLTVILLSALVLQAACPPVENYYELNVLVYPLDSGTVTAPVGSMVEGTGVTLYANMDINKYYRFASWQVNAGDSGTTPILSFNMDEDKMVMAKFVGYFGGTWEVATPNISTLKGRTTADGRSLPVAIQFEQKGAEITSGNINNWKWVLTDYTLTGDHLTATCKISQQVGAVNVNPLGDSSGFDTSDPDSMPIGSVGPAGGGTVTTEDPTEPDIIVIEIDRRGAARRNIVGTMKGYYSPDRLCFYEPLMTGTKQGY